MFEEARSGLTLTDAWSAGRPLAVGGVSTTLPDLVHLPVTQRSRNNQMALAALLPIRTAIEECIARFGPGRIGIVLGTSTSGIADTENALRAQHVHGTLPATFHYAQQEMGSLAALLTHELGISGPAYVHSSACASAAKAMASAARLLRMGVCDAVISGGVDTLCAFTIAGFSALDTISPTRSNPLSANRNGINIGEGAALFLMSREPAAVALCGWGEASDGYHMSAPDPTGSGARLAITQALTRAGLQPEQIDYINLHGTGTLQNDAMESHVVHDLFGTDVTVSSTKPFTGHTLGAAAAIEAGLCWLALQPDNTTGILPPHLWDGEADPALPRLRIAEPGARLGRPLRYALSNSFAFGGANATLILGQT